MVEIVQVSTGAPDFDPLLVERLVLFARRRLWKITGRVVDPPEDYVHRAIELTLSGSRQRDADCEMFTHLAGVISSLVSHDVESVGNRLTASWPTYTTGEPVDFPDDTPTPEARLIQYEMDGEQNRLLKRVFDELDDDPDLSDFVQLLIDAPSTVAPRDIAEELHIAVEDVYLMRKRLRRRLRFLLEPAS